LKYLSSNICKSRLIKVQNHREFHTLSNYILTFIINCSYTQNKLKNMNENWAENAFPENLNMNLFLVDKCSSKCLYTEL